MATCPRANGTADDWAGARSRAPAVSRGGDARLSSVRAALGTCRPVRMAAGPPLVAGLESHGIEPPPGDRARADSWPVLFVLRDTEPGHLLGPSVQQAHLVCTACAQSVICLNPDTRNWTGYLVNPGEVTARTLAHIRLCHNAPPAPGV
jgi:hypothetical protein